MNNLSREELVNLWQSVELAIATTRLTIGASPRMRSERPCPVLSKMRTLKELSKKIQSELRVGDRLGWEESV